MSIGSWLLGFLQVLVAYVRDNVFNFLDWKITQHFVSYWEFGFVKRGLIGSITKPIFKYLNLNFTQQSIVLIFIYFLIFLTFVIYLDKLLKNKKFGSYSLILRAILIFSPLGFFQWSYDLGRFDQIIFLILIFICHLINKEYYLLSGILAVVCSLIHEASSFYGLSIIAINILIRYKFENLGFKFKIIIKNYLPMFLVLILVFLFGSLNESELDMIKNYGQGWRVWNRGALEPNFKLTFYDYSLILIYLFALIKFFSYLIKKQIDFFELLLCLLPALSLFALGIDYARWLHVLFFTFLIPIISSLNSNITNEKLSLKSINGLSILFLIIPLGPIGVIEPLPYMYSFFQKIF